MDIIQIEEFDQVYKIMENSFPKTEYRAYSDQKALFSNPEYKIYAQRGDDRQIIAFIALWELENHVYIEHFAVAKEFRGMGLGAKMLSEISKAYDTPLCLEVEPAQTEIAVKRIGFYERNGFFYNDHHYIQPSMGEGREPIELKIMTYQSPVSEKEFESIRDLLYKKVYRIL